MIVKAIKTRKVTPRLCALEDLLGESIPELREGSVVAIATKVVSLCEGRVEPLGANKDELIARESRLYLPGSLNPYGVSLSVVRNKLVWGAGIDDSNTGGHYTLWPADPQASANCARAFLRRKFGVKKVGVILTDSSISPLERGTTGTSIAYSGFEPLRDYKGEEDLFGRAFVYQSNNIQNGLAAAAAVVGGEGGEQTPIVVLEDLDFVNFVERDPTAEEIDALRIEPGTDAYAPMFKQALWREGERRA